MAQNLFIDQCKRLIEACDQGKLGQTVMPEDANPGWQDTPADRETRIAYFTLTMALNYQRDSYKLWEAALKTYQDPETRFVFDVTAVTQTTDAKLRAALTKYKLALQPNKHIATWRTIATTISTNWKNFSNFFAAHNFDFLKIQEQVQKIHKKGFPYLSGPKIFNYWSSIIERYVGITLTNTEHIAMAVDTHIRQCSVVLGVISPEEAERLEPLAVAEKWRLALHGSDITPTQMHFVLWFWSRNGFLFKL